MYFCLVLLTGTPKCKASSASDIEVNLLINSCIWDFKYQQLFQGNKATAFLFVTLFLSVMQKKRLRIPHPLPSTPLKAWSLFLIRSLPCSNFIISIAKHSFTRSFPKPYAIPQHLVYILTSCLIPYRLYLSFLSKTFKNLIQGEIANKLSELPDLYERLVDNLKKCA